MSDAVDIVDLVDRLGCRDDELTEAMHRLGIRAALAGDRVVIGRADADRLSSHLRPSDPPPVPSNGSVSSRV